MKSFIILTGLRRSVWRVGGAHLLVIAPGQHSSFWRNVAAVANRWQHCVRFDRPEIWTSDLPLQRRTRYRSTSCAFANQRNVWRLLNFFIINVIKNQFVFFPISHSMQWDLRRILFNQILCLNAVQEFFFRIMIFIFCWHMHQIN